MKIIPWWGIVAQKFLARWNTVNWNWWKWVSSERFRWPLGSTCCENSMAFEQASNHKHGPLKQQNKKHKHGRHRSKSEIDRVNKGWVMKLFSFIQVDPSWSQNCVELQVELELKSSQRKLAKLPEKLIADNRWKYDCVCPLLQIRTVQLPKPVGPYDHVGLHWLFSYNVF